MQYKIRLKDGSEFGPSEIDGIVQWARERRIPNDAMLVPEDGSPVQSVLSVKEVARILQAPPTVSTGVPPVSHASKLALIPTGNPCALVGYYLAVFSLVMVPLAAVAIVLGILGLLRVRKHPEAKGTAHAWVAILGGLAIPLLYVLFFMFILPAFA